MLKREEYNFIGGGSDKKFVYYLSLPHKARHCRYLLKLIISSLKILEIFIDMFYL